MDPNLPNYLTVLRIVAIPVILMSFYFEDSRFAHRIGAGIFLVTSITDFLDGYLARKYNLVSRFGNVFDPIADKVLVGCVILLVVKYNKANEVPCLLILAREFTVAGLREFLAQIHVSVPVSRLGKVKTAMQMTALTMLILGSAGSGLAHLDQIAHICLWIAAILTVISGFSYLKASSKYL